MPDIDLPVHGELNWSPKLLSAITEVNEAVDALPDALAAHVASPTPHPEYDDLPSFELLFENGLI